MASRVGDVVLGALKVKNVPDTVCFESIQDLLQSLPQHYTIELPLSLSNVVTGSQQPNEDETNKIWNRRSGGGVSKGLYVFSAGEWVLAQGVPTGVVSWWYASDGEPPDGYAKVESTTSALPTAVKNQLILDYLQDPTNSFDVWFAIIRL